MSVYGNTLFSDEISAFNKKDASLDSLMTIRILSMIIVELGSILSIYITESII